MSDVGDPIEPSEPAEPVRWWSAKRFAEFAVHFVIFSVLWLSWSRFEGSPPETPRMCLIGGSLAAGLTWGIPLWKRITGES